MVSISKQIKSNHIIAWYRAFTTFHCCFMFCSPKISPAALQSHQLQLCEDSTSKSWGQTNNHTVDGGNPAPPVEVGSSFYPIIFRVLYIPGGARFLPSTVSSQKIKSLFKKPKMDSQKNWQNPKTLPVCLNVFFFSHPKIPWEFMAGAKKNRWVFFLQ